MAVLKIFNQPQVKARLQELTAAGATTVDFYHEFGARESQFKQWKAALAKEMQEVVQNDAAVIYDDGQRTARQALVKRQFDLFDELHKRMLEIDIEINEIRKVQRTTNGFSAQNALAMFAGYRVVRGYLERMGGLLGQLEPAQAPSVQLTRIETLLNIAVPADKIPEHLHKAVFGTPMPHIPVIDQDPMVE